MAGKYSSVTLPPMEGSITSIKYEWEIEFSRFFNFPSSSLSFTSSPMLRPLAKSRTCRGRGTWMSSSSIASLNLICEPSNPETILTVLLRGILLEEHFTCNLHFSWPQVSCVTQCPTRGSRVVFASYRDSYDQIQKFALRFATSSDAQAFINSVKVQPAPLRIVQQESMTNGMEIGLPNTSLGSEVSSQSEFVSSDGVQYRAQEELSLLNHVGTYSPEIPAVLNYNYERSCSQELLFSRNVESICSGLPPSFTALLTNCSSEVQEEKPMVVPEEIDFKSQITRYMSDSSFHEMLTKVEEVINEIGGDLTL